MSGPPRERPNDGGSRPAPVGRTLPQAVEAEASVLGTIILRNDQYSAVAEHLGEADFYSPQHQVIFRAMSELEQAGKPIDPITLEEHLRRSDLLEKAGGLERLLELTTLVPTTENLPSYVRIVRDKSLIRRLIQVTTEISGQGYGDYGEAEEFLGVAEQSIFALTQKTKTQTYTPLRPILKQTFALIEQLNNQKGEVTGVPTGFTEFDGKTNGLQPGDLVILAARPSMGKTALALNMASQASLMFGIPVLVFSLEMTKEMLVQRLLCCESRVDSEKLRKGFVDMNDWRRLTDAASRLDQSKVFIDDTPSASLQQVRSKCRRFRSDREIFDDSVPKDVTSQQAKGLIIVDYLQLMQASSLGSKGSESREREVSEISRGLKAMAKELRMPVIALSQLNRSLEKREDKRPNLSDLRESGAIEQDADVIVFIYRDEVYTKDKCEKKGIAEIIIGKQRNGPTGVVELAWLGQFTKFENLSGRGE